MRRTVYYGYSPKGEFHIRIYGQLPDAPGSTDEQFVALSRIECNKISKHMQFGKKGEERFVETVNGQEVKQ